MRLFGFLVFIFFSTYGSANYELKVKVNGKPELSTKAGEPTNLMLKLTNRETGESPHHYMKMHDKLMHMILVSDDLEQFYHVHPEFNHHHGSFKIQLNAAVAPDPDNLDTLNTLVTPGTYSAFTEVMPHDDDMMMVFSRFPLQVINSPLARPQEPNPVSDKFVKFYDENGRDADFEAKYRVSFRYDLHQWCSWWLPKFYVLVEVWDGEKSTYTAVQNLERWLSMGGHAILVSRAENLEARSFYHLHALLPIIQPGEFVFPYHDHKKGMDDGDYRIFVQFKHEGIIQKINFDFQYENPPLPLGPMQSFGLQLCL